MAIKRVLILLLVLIASLSFASQTSFHMKRFLSVLLTLILGLSFSMNAFAANAALPVGGQTRERYLVLLRDTADTRAVGRVRALIAQQGKVYYEYQNIKAFAIELPAMAAERLAANPAVAVVEPDAIATISDYSIELNNSWGVDHIDADKTWPDNSGAGFQGNGIKVGVIDTGISPHSDLPVPVDGIRFVSSDLSTTSWLDDNGHGTHVAGTIGARKNGEGVVGVAPEVNLYAIKVLDSTGSGAYSDIAAGIDWAISQGLDIVNLSLGGTYDSPTLKAMVDRAYDSGVLVVAAAGNSGGSARRDTVNYPAKYDSAMAVAATDSSDLRAPFSSTGSTVDIAAPGVAIMSTVMSGGYEAWSGTSMATPHVSGTLALLKQANPGYSVEALRQLLYSMAKDLGTAGKDTLYGNGLVQAFIAIPQPTADTTTSVTVPQLSYSRATTKNVPITITVCDSAGSAAARVSVTVNILIPGKSPVMTVLVTDSYGAVTWNYATSKKSPLGEYVVNVVTTATSSYNVSEGSASFTLGR